MKKQTAQQMAARRKSDTTGRVYTNSGISEGAKGTSAASSRVYRPLGTHLTTLQDKVGMPDSTAQRMMDESVAKSGSNDVSGKEMEAMLKKKLKEKLMHRMSVQ